jgi:hypothetical protein
MKKKPRVIQLVPPSSRSQEKLRLAKLQNNTEKVPVSTLEKRPPVTEIIPKEFSKLPKVVIQQVFPFLSDNTQKNLSYVSKSLYHHKKELIRVVTIGNESFWSHFDTPQKLFDHYQHYKNVTEIRFGEGSITPERMRMLAEAMKKGCFPELKTLTIGRGAFQNSTEIDLIPVLQACSNLRHLKMVSSPGPSIQTLKHCPQLESLDLRGYGNLSLDDLTIILSILPKLTWLQLPRNVTDEQLTVIARFCPCLEEVHFFSSTDITEKGVIHFFERHKKLKKLTLDIDLGNEAFTPKALDFIWTNLQELQNLDIHSQEFQDPHYKTFAGLPTSLISLKFSSTAFATDASFENFPFLPELKHLHISHGQCGLKLTDPTFLHIAKQCPNLRYLGLKGVRIRTHKGLKGLSEQTLIQILSRYPNLVYLDLSQIEDLTDATLLTIGQLLPKLRFLDLHFSDGFTTEGLDLLGQHCKLITHVNLKNAIRMGFTYTIQELTKIFPNLKYGLYSENQPIHFPETDLLKAGIPSWEP